MMIVVIMLNVGSGVCRGEEDRECLWDTRAIALLVSTSAIRDVSYHICHAMRGEMYMEISVICGSAENLSII